MTEHVLDYVDDYLYDLLSPRDAELLEAHCERCRICKVALEEARKRQAALEALPAVEPGETLVRQTLDRIDTFDARRRRLLRRFVRGLALATAASVLLVGSLTAYYLTRQPTPYDLRLLGQSRLAPGSMASLRVNLLRSAGGAPVAAAPVEIELRGQDKVVQLASFTTNDQGSGDLHFRLPDWTDGEYQLRVVAHIDGKDEELTQTVHLRRSWKVMLSSDKPVYQPGQTILVRSLALRRADLQPVAGEPVTFTVADPKGNIIFKQQGQSSKYGLAGMGCPLATEIIEGVYAVVCKVGDTESKLTVEVKKYVLPKFKIDVALDQPYYAPGQTVKGTVH